MEIINYCDENNKYNIFLYAKLPICIFFEMTKEPDIVTPPPPIDLLKSSKVESREKSKLQLMLENFD
jgi:hypothetical protein